MKFTDYEILEALDEGRKIRRQLWWENTEDKYVKADKKRNLYFMGENGYILSTDDLWARDWEVI